MHINAVIQWLIDMYVYGGFIFTIYVYAYTYMYMYIYVFTHCTCFTSSHIYIVDLHKYTVTYLFTFPTLIIYLLPFLVICLLFLFISCIWFCFVHVSACIRFSDTCPDTCISIMYQVFWSVCQTRHWYGIDTVLIRYQDF